MQVKNMLNSVFGMSQPATAEPAPKEPAKKEKPPKRYIQNVYSGVSAQRFFDPNYHAIAPPPRPAPERFADEGVGPALGTHGPWGQPLAMEPK